MKRKSYNRSSASSIEKVDSDESIADIVAKAKAIHDVKPLNRLEDIGAAIKKNYRRSVVHRALNPLVVSSTPCGALAGMQISPNISAISSASDKKEDRNLSQSINEDVIVPVNNNAVVDNFITSLLKLPSINPELRQNVSRSIIHSNECTPKNQENLEKINATTTNAQDTYYSSKHHSQHDVSKNSVNKIESVQNSNNVQDVPENVKKQTGTIPKVVLNGNSLKQRETNDNSHFKRSYKNNTDTHYPEHKSPYAKQEDTISSTSSYNLRERNTNLKSKEDKVLNATRNATLSKQNHKMKNKIRSRRSSNSDESSEEKYTNRSYSKSTRNGDIKAKYHSKYSSRKNRSFFSDRNTRERISRRYSRAEENRNRSKTIRSSRIRKTFLPNKKRPSSYDKYHRKSGRRKRYPSSSYSSSTYTDSDDDRTITSERMSRVDKYERDLKYGRRRKPCNSRKSSQMNRGSSCESTKRPKRASPVKSKHPTEKIEAVAANSEALTQVVGLLAAHLLKIQKDDNPVRSNEKSTGLHGCYSNTHTKIRGAQKKQRFTHAFDWNKFLGNNGSHKYNDRSNDTSIELEHSEEWSHGVTTASTVEAEAHLLKIQKDDNPVRSNKKSTGQHGCYPNTHTNIRSAKEKQRSTHAFDWNKFLGNNGSHKNWLDKYKECSNGTSIDLAHSGEWSPGVTTTSLVEAEFLRRLARNPYKQVSNIIRTKILKSKLNESRNHSARREKKSCSNLNEIVNKLTARSTKPRRKKNMIVKSDMKSKRAILDEILGYFPRTRSETIVNNHIVKIKDQATSPFVTDMNMEFSPRRKVLQDSAPLKSSPLFGWGSTRTHNFSDEDQDDVTVDAPNTQPSTSALHRTSRTSRKATRTLLHRSIQTRQDSLNDAAMKFEQVDTRNVRLSSTKNNKTSQSISDCYIVDDAADQLEPVHSIQTSNKDQTNCKSHVQLSRKRLSFDTMSVESGSSKSEKIEKSIQNEAPQSKPKNKDAEIGENPRFSKKKESNRRNRCEEAEISNIRQSKHVDISLSSSIEFRSEDIKKSSEKNTSTKEVQHSPVTEGKEQKILILQNVTVARKKRSNVDKNMNMNISYAETEMDTVHTQVPDSSQSKSIRRNTDQETEELVLRKRKAASETQNMNRISDDTMQDINSVQNIEVPCSVMGPKSRKSERRKTKLNVEGTALANGKAALGTEDINPTPDDAMEELQEKNPVRNIEVSYSGPKTRKSGRRKTELDVEGTALGKEKSAFENKDIKPSSDGTMDKLQDKNSVQEFEVPYSVMGPNLRKSGRRKTELNVDGIALGKEKKAASETEDINNHLDGAIIMEECAPSISMSNGDIVLSPNFRKSIRSPTITVQNDKGDGKTHDIEENKRTNKRQKNQSLETTILSQKVCPDKSLKAEGINGMRIQDSLCSSPKNVEDNMLVMDQDDENRRRKDNQDSSKETFPAHSSRLKTKSDSVRKDEKTLNNKRGKKKTENDTVAVRASTRPRRPPQLCWWKKTVTERDCEIYGNLFPPSVLSPTAKNDRKSAKNLKIKKENQESKPRTKNNAKKISSKVAAKPKPSTQGVRRDVDELIEFDIDANQNTDKIADNVKSPDKNAWRSISEKVDQLNIGISNSFSGNEMFNTKVEHGILRLSPLEERKSVNLQNTLIYYVLKGTFSLKVGHTYTETAPILFVIPKGKRYVLRNKDNRTALLAYIIEGTNH